MPSRFVRWDREVAELEEKVREAEAAEPQKAGAAAGAGCCG
jgi:hypothetical protein